MRGLLDNVAALGRQPDLLLIVVFVTILLMMILPLPTLLMDFLITLNIAASIIILILALQLKTAVQFTTFPSLLLLTTLFRLAISISTTRLILLEGSAGQIVETFGNVVVGGNLVVGLVIFLIITVVQFLVITKGADRVAEVGARFTLDGMPGKQMSVDADVRAGNIDQITARDTRSLLERETKLFGAMDGAMKFVKGDAIAGLVITAINLIGGIAIGMSQFSLSFGEALTLYSLLTIGDGLVAQIPALLISVSAGTIVTRVTNPNGSTLATEIGEQITHSRRNLIVAGCVIAAFGFIPGFPTMIFLAVGASISLGILWTQSKEVKKANEKVTTWERVISRNHLHCADVQKRKGLAVKVDLVLPNTVFLTKPRDFDLQLSTIVSHSENELGVPMGLWRVQIDRNEQERWRMHLNGEVVASGIFYPNQLFVKANRAYVEALGITVQKDFGTHEGSLVSAEDAQLLQDADVPFQSDLALLFMDLRTSIAKSLGKFIDVEATTSILDSLKKSHANLIRDIREGVTISEIAAVLKALVEERIPLTAKTKVLEAILVWAPKRTDPYDVLQQVRLAIDKFLNNRYAPEGFLQCIVISPTLESYIREGFRNADDQRYLIIENSISAQIAKQVDSLIPLHFVRGKSPVILTQQDIRRAVHNVLEQHGIYIPVLAYQEIHPETVIYPVKFIGPDDEGSVTDRGGIVR